MKLLLLINKHFKQIQNGGLIIFLIKLKNLFYLLIQIPIYFISLLLIPIIRLISPLFLIRWGFLKSSRIGHLAIDAELYLCKRNEKINSPTQRYIDIFFLSSKYICNRQFYKMLQRELIFIPSFFLLPLFRINRFFPGGKQHEIGINNSEDRDIHDILHKYPPHISFTKEEESQGKKILHDFEIPEDAKIICLIVRDSFYLGRHSASSLEDFNKENTYRDGNIDNYKLAAEELAERGYYVLRMGRDGIKPFNINNKKVIDYANTKIRSDFMDVYLGAKCQFCISTGCGFDAIPYIFRKPIAYIQQVLGHIHTERKQDLLLLQPHFHNKNNQKLNMSQIFLSNLVLAENSDDFEKENIFLGENTPQEIKDFVIEMEERLRAVWKESEEDILLQIKFWNLFQEILEKVDITKFDKVEKKNKIFVINLMRNIKKKAKFSSKFLKENKDWIQ